VNHYTKITFITLCRIEKAYNINLNHTAGQLRIEFYFIFASFTFSRNTLINTNLLSVRIYIARLTRISKIVHGLLYNLFAVLIKAFDRAKKAPVV